MELHEAIFSRRSVRDYEPTALEKPTLRRLIEAAVQAPSAVNTQPWHFTVVQDRPLLARMSAASKAHMLRVTPPGTWAEHLEGMLRNPDFDIFYAAAALIVISSMTRDEWAVENCALAAQNLMLEARAQGLGTCWIGFAQAWLGTSDGRSALGLPEAYLPVAPIIVGHPRALPAPVPRRDPQIRWLPG